MTTIAWDGKNLATDSQGTAGNIRVSTKRKKLFSFAGTWFACAGNLEDCDAFRQWYCSGAPEGKKPKLENFSAFVVKGNKAWRYEEKLIRYDLPAPAAEGTGKDLALGAMGAGLSAAEAVRVAIRFDVNSGGRVQVSK